MADTTENEELLEENAPSSYTTETQSEPTGSGQSVTAPGIGLGRRKSAVARVRLIPGSGEWKINGRTLENYFPNKLHQQLVRAPFTLLDLEGRFDVIARVSGGGTSGQAGAVRLGIHALLSVRSPASRRHVRLRNTPSAKLSRLCILPGKAGFYWLYRAKLYCVDEVDEIMHREYGS